MSMPRGAEAIADLRWDRDRRLVALIASRLQLSIASQHSTYGAVGVTSASSKTGLRDAQPVRLVISRAHDTIFVLRLTDQSTELTVDGTFFHLRRIYF